MNDEKAQEKPFSANPLLDEVRKEREALEKVRDEARHEANRLEQLKANSLLGSTAGIRPETQDKQETAKEYADRVMNVKNMPKK